MKYDIFISYSRLDIDFVNKLTQILDAGGYTYFIDTKSINAGVSYSDAIEQAIENSSLLIFVFSKNANHSRWGKAELNMAFSDNKAILPVCIDHTPLTESFHILFGKSPLLDFSNENDYSVMEEKLLRAVGKILRRPDAKSLTEEQRKSNIEAAKERRNGSSDYIPNRIDIDIFISYRRVDGREYARSTMQALKILGYPKVFFDYNSIRDGVFNTQIIDAIYSCNDFILIISPLALKNCSREGDWVAKEIRTALKYNKKIIPVVIEDTFKDWPVDFPKDLSLIKDIQFHKLMTDEYFEDSIEKLTKRLITAVSTEKNDFIRLQDLQTHESIHKETVVYKIKVNRRCRLLIDDEETQIIEASKLVKISLPIGEYIRKVVALEDDTISDEAVIILEHDKVDIVSL